MAKLITLRYPATCRKCRKRMAAGEQGFWRKGYGTIHPACQNDPQPKPPTDNDTPHEVTLDYADVKQKFLDTVSGRINGLNSRRWGTLVSREWKSQSDWVGCTIDDMRSWLSRGFQVEGLRNVSADVNPNRKARKLKYSEEGEMQIDLMLSGFDYPFLEWDRREKKPGMRINIGLNYNASTDIGPMIEYQKWVAQALYSIESQGIDAEVNLKISVRDLYIGGPKKQEILIRVKKENEASDFTNWSAMFSPGGFRQLGFTALIMTADAGGWTVTDYLGGTDDSKSTKFDASWNEESQTLDIKLNSSAREFPAEEMTTKLRAIMEEISKG